MKTFENTLFSMTLSFSFACRSIRQMKQASQILNEILSERKASNPSYSLRAFARDIGLSAPQLSNVMNGHRGLSQKMAAKVTNNLPLSTTEKAWFTESLKAQFSPSKNERKIADETLKNLRKDYGRTTHLQLDLFKVISTWHHFALLELIKISGSKKNQTTYFAKNLNIPESEVTNSLERLERLELIDLRGRVWVVNQDTVIADQGVPTEAVRNYHKQMLEKSIQAVALQTAKDRYGYSGALPVRVKSVERAKKLIQKFKDEFAAELSDEENGEEIYGFSFQFFRLSEPNVEE